MTHSTKWGHPRPKYTPPARCHKAPRGPTFTGCAKWETPVNNNLLINGLLPVGVTAWPGLYAFSLPIQRHFPATNFYGEIVLLTGDGLFGSIVFQLPAPQAVFNLQLNRLTPEEKDWHQSFLIPDFCSALMIPWREDGFDAFTVPYGDVRWQLLLA